MSLQIFGSNSIGAGIRADLGTTDDVFVGVGANVGSTDNYAIDGWGSNHSVVVEGMVTGSVSSVIRLGDDAELDNGEHVLVGARGGISAFGQTAAVRIEAHDSTVDNHGAIWSEATAILMQGIAGPASVSHIVNDGSIIGLGSGIVHETGTEALRVENSGLIQSGSYAFYSYASGNEQIINTGTMIGGIQLGEGNDLYDGHAGVHTGGIFYAGGGNDTVLGGAQNDELSGETGNDHIEGGAGDDLLYGDGDADTLLGGAGNDVVNGGDGADLMRGGGGNDRYVVDNAADVVNEAGTNGVDLVGSTISFSLTDTIHVKGVIENLQLLGSSNISGTGNALANWITGTPGNNALSGGLGNDTLIGDAGSDVLDGGRGHDLLTGGLGNDRFHFASAADSLANSSRDAITDFDDFGNDRIDLSAVYAGTLHYVGNHAFTGAGQVHVVDIAGPDLMVEVNLGGSLAPDMQILLAGTTLASMTAGDFIL